MVPFLGEILNGSCGVVDLTVVINRTVTEVSNNANSALGLQTLTFECLLSLCNNVYDLIVDPSSRALANNWRRSVGGLLMTKGKEP